MTQIADYLFMYLNSEIYCVTPDGIGKLCTLSMLGNHGLGMNPGYKEYAPENGVIKPILRPWSDITEEEKKELEIVAERFENRLLVQSNYESMRKALKMRIDIFGLIEDGVAESTDDYPEIYAKPGDHNKKFPYTNKS